ncbi:hypothetical protein KVT40_004513 [Elsinoe batatas]|uniref:Uncharacterized protein n=1 Tax=Elsinoe batatas TaxID=2601811 RepID=A0A8K0PCK4_9PEZI|nr:hypothetical protein KVT40_004513 [Elsinoe batatas]
MYSQGDCYPHGRLLPASSHREKADSQARLDSIVDASYLGPPYFDETEVARLESTVFSDGLTLAVQIQTTLDERLGRRTKKRIESDDFRVCAAHDLAPIFEKAFSIAPKHLARNQKFVDLVDVHGLSTPEDWRMVFTKTDRCGPKPRPGKRKPR